MGIGGSLECLVDQCEERTAVDEAEDVLHIRGESHFNLGIPVIQIQKFDPELLSERLLLHFSEDRFFHPIVHRVPFPLTALSPMRRGGG